MVATGPGEAVANANSYHTYSVGYCLKWVRTTWEVNSLYASAIDAWNGARKKHPGDRNPPKGAPCFYRGGQYGHIVIFKETQMRSTDCPSAGQVNDAAISWVEQHWGYTYLGWTEDLNGVTLPNLVKTEPPKEEDDVPQYDHARHAGDRNIKADTWTLLQWDAVPAGKAFEVGNPGCNMANRLYSATINLTLEAPAEASVQVQAFEWKDGETVESNPIARFTNGEDGWIRAQYAHQGSVAEGRRLRWRIKTSHDSVLNNTDAVVLSWGRG
jgi:hypothetical protein